jgi:quercetin dioxygenase-like cupin family protein
MPIARSADNPTFELAGNRITSLAAPSRGATEAILYRIDLPPGGALPSHRHDHQDVFHVLSGTVTAVVDGERAAIETGDTVVVPIAATHHAEAGPDGATIIVTMLAGTLFIHQDGTSSVPPWGA